MSPIAQSCLRLIVRSLSLFVQVPTQYNKRWTYKLFMQSNKAFVYAIPAEITSRWNPIFVSPIIISLHTVTNVLSLRQTFFFFSVCFSKTEKTAHSARFRWITFELLFYCHCGTIANSELSKDEQRKKKRKHTKGHDQTGHPVASSDNAKLYKITKWSGDTSSLALGVWKLVVILVLLTFHHIICYIEF